MSYRTVLSVLMALAKLRQIIFVKLFVCLGGERDQTGLH